MKKPPRTLPERKKARKDIADRILAAAHREIAQIGRSGVCVNGNHDRCPYGDTWVIDCLCECHDKAAPSNDKE